MKRLSPLNQQRRSRNSKGGAVRSLFCKQPIHLFEEITTRLCTRLSFFFSKIKSSSSTRPYKTFSSGSSTFCRREARHEMLWRSLVDFFFVCSSDSLLRFLKGVSLSCYLVFYRMCCWLQQCGLGHLWWESLPPADTKKKKFSSFLVKVKFSVCVWGAWRLPGWLPFKWCSSVYWLLLLERILFLFNVWILYLYWMQHILLWKSQMQTEPMTNRFQ